MDRGVGAARSGGLQDSSRAGMLPPTAERAAPRRAALRRRPLSSRRHASVPSTRHAAVPALTCGPSPSVTPVHTHACASSSLPSHTASAGKIQCKQETVFLTSPTSSRSSVINMHSFQCSGFETAATAAEAPKAS